MPDTLLDLLPTRKGHFQLESGHHGDLWLDLELLCLRPERVRGPAIELGQRLTGHGVEVVCGPLVEGAFVAFMVASLMAVEFVYAERFAPSQTDALFPVQYRLPDALRRKVRGKRVAIVNDVINAGSAVRGTFADLLDCGAQPVAVAALLVLGPSALEFASSRGITLESLANHPNTLWPPKECPLCSAGVPLDNACRVEL
jgi:orotate phosphoribosyltransferase